MNIDRKALTDAVAFASRALPRNAPHPVLNGLRIATVEGAVVLSAFDYDTYAEATVAQIVETGPDLLVPGRALGSYLSGMRGSTVAIDADENHVRVTCGSAKVTLPRLSLDDYPSPPPVPPSVGTVDGEDLAVAVTSVWPAVDPNNAITTLRGYVVDSSDGLVFAGGSRFAFAVRTLTSWDGEPFPLALVPVTIADAAKALTGRVVIGRDDGRVSLSTDDRTITVRTFDGEPPTFRKLFDAHAPTTTVTLDRAELAERLKWIAAGDTRKDSRGQLVVTVTADSLGIALYGADSLDASEELEAKVDGDGLEMGYKAEYLLDGLNGTSAATVTLGLVSATKPCLVTAESDPGYSYLAMPFRLHR